MLVNLGKGKKGFMGEEGERVHGGNHWWLGGN